MIFINQMSDFYTLFTNAQRVKLVISTNLYRKGKTEINTKTYRQVGMF